ncbi:putative dehydrogenase [Paenibacillus shirakamiensis]|uniref:Dehydrogenase n=1 Tax=Paenibacillus shirakamiensis TaxID=1265935 RepID=A0ABS4JJR8_9BACL|nr:Gfo/Idh/MocA family oxidoreductase [Paenibacillus shirakamiensis]MBP2001954.1 putative dehydrogenase [Paenibacillus shirakamiensis]
MIQFAIVGCGHIADKHLEAILQVEGAQLAAVCDTNVLRLEEWGARTGAATFIDLEEMLLRMPEISVICICTPSGLHAPLAVKAAQAGRHLIIEKPVALTIEDGDAILRAVQRYGVKAAAVHPNRYRPAVRYLKWALDSGKFGRISHVNATVRWNRNQAYYDQAPWRGTRAMDGGVLMNQAIHNLDLLLWLFGPVQDVQAMADTRLRHMECEDVAIATVRFHSGVLGVVEAATTVYERNLEESISVFGEHGYAVIGGPTAQWIKQWKCSSMTEGEIAQLRAKVEQDPLGIPGHQRIIQDMVTAIREDRSPAITAADGMHAVRLIDQMLLSSRAEQSQI